MPPQKKKLTKTVVETLVLPVKGQTFVWDSELIGFGVKLTPTGRTYVAERRVNGKTRRVTLGKHGVLTADQARSKAIKTLAEMTDGLDPNARKREPMPPWASLLLHSLKPQPVFRFEKNGNTFTSDKSSVICDTLYISGIGLTACTAIPYNTGMKINVSATGNLSIKDPILFHGDINVYCYVSNDPVNWIDSEGLQRGGRRNRRRGPTGRQVRNPYAAKIYRKIQRELKEKFDIDILRDEGRNIEWEDVDRLEEYYNELVRLRRLQCKPGGVTKRNTQKKINTLEEALQQYEEIQKTQNNDRQGKGDNTIKSIEKSRQREE